MILEDGKRTLATKPRRTRTVVDRPTTKVTVVVGRGPRGEPGAGGSGSRLTFTQASPSASWLIAHNLGYRPVVALFTLLGREIESDVENPDVNTTVVTFATPTAGSAELR